MKLSEAFNEFRRLEIRAKGCSPNTDRGYKMVGDIAVRYFGDIRIRKIRVDDVSDFYLDLIEPKTGARVSKNTAREYVSKLRNVIRFCRKKNVRVVNPDEITLPKPEKKHANFITDREFFKFLELVGKPRRGYARINRERNVLIAKMLFFGGLRIGELCALNRDTIRNCEFVVVGKSKDPRPCFITDDIRAGIERYLGMRDDENPALFISNETGERITPHNVQQIFRGVSKRAGMGNITPHTLRHSFATYMLEGGVDVRYVAAFLGHQSLNTTERYTHIRNSKMKELYVSIMGKLAVEI